jgi:aminoacrylate hydrolase
MPVITTANARVSYTRTGSGPAVLMIQGVGVAGSGWRPQTDALGREFTVISYDNRGIGGSSLPAAPLTIEAMADDGLHIMDAEGIERTHVIGHSMGGLIALHMALAARDRVKSLALLCTCADGRHITAPSLRMLILGLGARIGTPAMRRKGMLRMIMPQDYLHGIDRAALARELEELFGHDLADQPPIVTKQLKAMSRYAASGRLNELNGIPTLVVSAAHDPIAPPALGRALAAGIPAARYIEYGNASHALPIQCAADVNALLLEHLSAAEGRASRPVEAQRV